MKIRIQNASEKFWYDESGDRIPYKRITAMEKACEKALAKIAKDGIALSEKMAKFKEHIRDTAQALYEQFLEENGGQSRGKGKGNVMLYNFDRSIKLEVSIDERITFDDNLIELAKDRLYSFIDKNAGGIDDFIKDLIMSAFETSRGKLDAKKVLSLKKHAERISDPLFHEAMKFIDRSIRRPQSKAYYRIWVKGPDGEYQNVDLNFSSIQI